MSFEIPFMESQLKELKETQEENRRKACFWRRLFTLSLLAIVMFAVLAFIFGFTIECDWLPVFFSVCMVLSLILFLFSLNRWQMWQDRIEKLSLFITPIEARLITAYHSKITCRNKWEVKKNGELRCCGSSKTIPKTEELKVLQEEGYDIFIDDVLYFKGECEDNECKDGKFGA